MKKYRAVFLVAITFIALVVLGYALVHNVHFALLQPSGQVADHESQLLIFAFSIMMVVVIPVFCLLGIFAWKYRAGNEKEQKYDPEWSENKKLEIIWWSIPIAIIITLGTTAVITAHTLDPYQAIKSDVKPVNVQVVALEWKWLFIYPDLGVASVNELPVPVQTPIHFELSADAPMSAFWVPSLGSQIYTMSGMSSQLNLMADKPGTFPGYNTNINGSGYAEMKFNVYAQSAHDFNKWVASARNSTNEMNSQTLDQITKPGLMKETSYTLTESGLYDKVVMKYMKGMMPDANASQGASSKGNGMSDMEGM